MTNMDPMAKPLTDQERDDIARLLQDGKSHAEIARTVGRATGTVANVAKAIGHTGDQSASLRVRRANEGRSAYSAERRASIAATLTQRAEELLAEMEGRYLVFNFGGKDNTYEEHELESPPIEAKRQMIQAAREAIRTVLDIDRHDNRQDEGAAAVDQWLRDIVGDAVGVGA